MMAGSSSHIHFKGNRCSSKKRDNEEDKFVFFTPVSEKISIKESILQLDHVRLQRNLAKGDLLGDGLFHAISAGSVAAVEIICGFYKSQLGDIALQELVNSYPTGTEFLSVATPLQLAAENDDLRISQILVNCGAKLPSLSDALSESTTDELARGLIRFHWYKAATSPALILLTEANPFGRAFQLAFQLSRSGYEPRPRFSQDVQRLCGNLEDLLCAILSKARTKREVYAVLETGSNYNNEDTSPNVSKQRQFIQSGKHLLFQEV
ncbi:putative transient receptor potential-gamma protein isoform X2 [Apostichopus japonicus]|uniref:Putative transient receptor potential-gamma protein isoform X2 n=1 Tax=Stichopus japonicus TaxID=307972 RepID=A0A2G8LQF6_STIJA|nr:putative transient receptor potential-gamma protein isoform X2 [Apostichopus japonicus]WDP79927.1 transient receptor potential gamma-1 [Apostichopus japonicus]